MTNQRFDAFESQTARPDNAYNQFSNTNASLQALELMAQQPPALKNVENRGLDFLDCSENPFQKGCEGPGKNPLEPKDNQQTPEDNGQSPADKEQKPKDEGTKESTARKWPPVAPAWGTPHAQGKEGREGSAGREGSPGAEGREGREGREAANTAIRQDLQEHEAGRSGKEKHPLLPKLEFENRRGRR